ncbi:type I restriction modification DNA specificity domain protein [Candidatus Malacoplasma girerdii]|uniref:Type I restriction modification DNA specificity domain protein n=1 Tax=Candidatus Malacoplasma girerdii TaxID=1318617 RepID=A0A097ST67_9BACT|nr:type I restriction modification DNA specificity domain protein [Candidatus Malacoplasma girerdii]
MSFSKFKFCDLVDYIQPTKYQVKTKESIQEKGNISVLTPGKSFVLGFTNESEGIFYASKENPIILFDDFTCSSQWVDFNFKVRSSACKILILKDNVKNITSLRFLFHLMKKIKVNIDESEHQRQWISRYSQIEVKIPSIAVQNKIAKALDTIAELKAELRARDKQCCFYLNKIISREWINNYLNSNEQIIYKKVKEIADLYSGLKQKNKEYFYLNANSKYITYKNIYENHSILSNLLEHVEVKSNEKQNKVKLGDLFFTISSETREEVGFNSEINFEPKENIYLNSFCFGFRLKDEYKDSIYYRYLNYLFKTDWMREQIMNCSNGTTRHNLSKKLFEEIEIMIPPIKIQQKIVTTLDVLLRLTKKFEGEIPTEISSREDQYKYYSELLLSY